MSETSNERLLEELAFGEDWRIDNLGRLISAVDGVQRKLDEVIAALPDKWSGDASELALSRLRVHRSNLGKFRGVLNQAQALITGMSETSCAASCANTVRRAEAQRLLSELPSGVVPSWVHDAVNQGRTVEVPLFGTIDLNQGTEDLSNFLGAGREEAAGKALAAMQQVIDDEAAKLQALSVEYDPLPNGDGTTEPVPPFEVPRGTGPGGPGGPVGGPGGPSVWDRPPLPDPRGPGDDGSGGDDSGGDDSGVDRPNDHPEPPDGPRDPGRDDWPGGNDGPGGNPGGGPGDWPGRRPSVDSGLDGSTVRSGLGAAGLGAVGLAAGAKLAGLGGGAAGVGGAGASGIAGLGSAGGGLRGAAAAAGAGGAGGSGSSASGSGARGGARPGGMMMGAAGAGGSEKKSRKPGLGGYLAPKLDDEDDLGPAARASRAGSREEPEL